MAEKSDDNVQQVDLPDQVRQATEVIADWLYREHEWNVCGVGDNRKIYLWKEGGPTIRVAEKPRT